MVVDAFVVSGLLQKLQHFGFDVESFIASTCSNKYENSLWLFHHKIQIGMLHKDWKQNTIISIIVLLFVMVNGKTRKSIDFVPVVLDDLVPGIFFQWRSLTIIIQSFLDDEDIELYNQFSWSVGNFNGKSICADRQKVTRCSSIVPF